MIARIGRDKSVQITRRSLKQLKRYADGEDVPVSVVRALAKEAGVSIDWLATGQDGEPQAGLQEEPARFAPQPPDVRVPRYDVKLSAGGGAFAERVRVLDYIPFTEAFLRRKLGRSSADGLVIVEAKGDSMEPTIGEGDLVMLDTQDNLVADGLYAFAFEDALHIKRLVRTADGLEVVSDNAAVYPAWRLARAELQMIQVIGRVRWIGKVL